MVRAVNKNCYLLSIGILSVDGEIRYYIYISKMKIKSDYLDCLFYFVNFHIFTIFLSFVVSLFKLFCFVR